MALAQGRDKAREMTEIIATIRITHQNEATLGGCDAAAQSIAVAFIDDRHDPRPVLGCEGLGAIGAPIIGDNYFPDDAGLS